MIEKAYPEDSAERKALEELRKAVEEKNAATKNYQKALAQAVKAGESNTVMAAVANRSETAIRVYRKRHDL